MYQQSDEDFDERGILKDGRSVRTPMFAMDALQKGVAEHAQNFRPRRITAADGSTLGLHKPGWRIETGGNVGDQLVRDGAAMDRAELYRSYDEAKAREYLTPTGAGERRDDGPRAGAHYVAEPGDHWIHEGPDDEEAERVVRREPQTRRTQPLFYRNTAA